MIQLPPRTPASAWAPPALSSLPSWKDAQRVAIDLETRDPDLTTLGSGVRRDPGSNYVIGIAFAIEDGPAAYLPFRHAGGGNLDPASVFGYLSDQLATFRGKLVGANLQYDFDWLSTQHGLGVFAHPWADVQNAEPLLDELQERYGLDAIAKRRGIPGKDDTMMASAARALGVDPKAGMWRLHSRFVGPYAEQDVRLPLQLLRAQERELEEQNLGRVWKLECDLQPVLLKMKQRGVKLDLDEMDRVRVWAESREAQCIAEVNRLSTVRLEPSDITKAAAIADVLRGIGVKILPTPTGLDSITAEFLASLEHPMAKVLNRARVFNRLRGSFIESRLSHAVSGRIHATFNQLRGEKPSRKKSGESAGARFGRLSCTSPNLQQDPSRDEEIGPRWRRVYVPDDGKQWVSADLSSQEPRWLVHYAEGAGIPSGIEMANRYRTDPRTDFHQTVADILGWEGLKGRKNAKEIGLGLCYGMGGGKLCAKLGLPTEKRSFMRGDEEVSYLGAGPEGQAILDEFDRAVPFVREMQRLAKRRAAARGYITTAGGRKCRFPPIFGGGYEWLHKALNRLVQGSSGDQVKAGMVAQDHAGIPLQLQVHDEVCWSAESVTDAREGARLLAEALPCRVPAVVDVEMGPSWGSCKGV